MPQVQRITGHHLSPDTGVPGTWAMSPAAIAIRHPTPAPTVRVLVSGCGSRASILTGPAPGGPVTGNY